MGSFHFVINNFFVTSLKMIVSVNRLRCLRDSRCLIYLYPASQLLVGRTAKPSVVRLAMKKFNPAFKLRRVFNFVDYFISAQVRHFVLGEISYSRRTWGGCSLVRCGFSEPIDRLPPFAFPRSQPVSRPETNVSCLPM